MEKEKGGAPQLSIIVPVYNVEEWLPRCLASIKAQTFKDWECILVDDGSPDGCAAIIDEWAAKDGRFIAIHKENGGTSTARNAGLLAARGEYIGFVDPDDWIEPDTYELALSAARETGAGIVQWRFIEEKRGASKPEAERRQGFFSIRESPEYFSVNVCNKLFRSSLVFNSRARFPPGVRVGEDRAFSFMCCCLSQRLYFLNRALYHYFFREGSSAQSQDKGLILGEAREITRLEAFAASLEGGDTTDGLAECIMLQKLRLKQNAIVALKRPDFRLFRSLFPEANRRVLGFFFRERTGMSLVMLLAALHLDSPAALLVFLWKRFLRKKANAQKDALPRPAD